MLMVHSAPPSVVRATLSSSSNAGKVTSELIESLASINVTVSPSLLNLKSALRSPPSPSFAQMSINPPASMVVPAEMAMEPLRSRHHR